MIKFGEIPQFGPRTPSKLIRLLGDESEYYLKGRRAESLAMGIAAFAYYRRVVENRKNALIGEIQRVAKHLGCDQSSLHLFEKAGKEISFEKSVELIRDAIPPSLLLRGGHNPMMLLHSALSDGLHASTDEDCLIVAQDIRAVLVDFVERAASAMDEHTELRDAVSRLLARRAARAAGKQTESKPEQPPVARFQ